MAQSLFVALALAALHPLTGVAANGPNLILEAGFDSAHAYVQAQARYTLRFYQAIDVRELEIHDPVVALAELRPIGEDRVTEATRDGRRYRVTERRYAVFPFASGDLVLSGAHVTGLVAVPGVSSPGMREPLRLDAPPATLAVLPIPALVGTEAWLPARALRVTESWTPELHEARAGEALRRTLRVEAAGVDAAQLPALDFGAPGFAVHPEPPRLENRFDGDVNIGVREQSFRVVPLHPGPLTVPALHLPWWDAVAGAPRMAQLAPHPLTVAPAVGLLTDPTPEPEATSSTNEVPVAPQPLPDASRRTDRRAPVTAFVGVVMLIALAWSASRVTARARRSPLREFRRACRRNDPHAARRALMRWAVERWRESPPRSLGELAARLSEPTMRAALRELDRHLYGPSDAPWLGRALAGFPGAKGAQRRNGVCADLPPLFPH